MLYEGYSIYVICAVSVFLSCSQQHFMDVLKVASLSICSAATSSSSVADLYIIAEIYI